ncbi:MAG: HEAT repeat domain-containing protein [Phycisphaerales bacterium]|nr:HEAT repeat domain-containing protein [Phycisphaerales bacterium]
MTDLTATLGFVMNELRRSRTAAFARLGRPAPTAGPSELALRALLAAGAVATSTLETDARRLVYSARSDVGPLTLVGVALALPRTQQTAQTAARQLDAHASVRLALSKLAAAERRLQAEDGSAPFLPLRALVDSGAVDAQTAGTPLSDNLYTRDGFLLTALLPPAPAEDFVIVAWPADSRTGTVFAADARGREATNEIIARAVGVSLIEIEDVYADGFGSPLRSGWRQQAVVGADAQAAQSTNSTQQAFEAIAALERTPPTGKALPTVLAEALRSDQPALVARASRALGVLRRTDQIATLVQLASEHADTGVRLQAMWALTRMRDARAQPAALIGLQSNDATLRALSATILGAQRVRSAGPALLRVAADPATPGDDQDRIAAITALADIGDADQLLALSAAVTTGSPAVAQALTYTFQTLSPSLAPDAEATTLVAVLGHAHGTLRRYAIQRLAELRVPATARALEGRLGREGRELLPLLQVAITQVRGDHTGVERSLTERAEELWAKVLQTWHTLPTNQRYAAGCGALILLLMLGIVLTARARARNRAAGEAWAALAAPSAPEFAETDDEVAEFGAPEFGDAEYDDTDYEDAEHAYDAAPADEVELDIGASGVFRADEYERDDLLPASSDRDEDERR